MTPTATEQLLVRRRGTALEICDATEPPFDEAATSFFERDWPDWLTGRIFDVDADEGR